MSYRIVQRNLVYSRTDAIVNITNTKPVCMPGAEMEIYCAAGFEKLLEERIKAGELSPRDVFVTSGFSLKAKWIIHAVLPVWNHENPSGYDLIRKCYRKVFSAAKEKKSIVFHCRYSARMNTVSRKRER